MAATYTEISLEDMDKFLKRAFRALRPKQNLTRGEVTYDLALSPNVHIRIYTSIHRGSEMGAGKGSDSIKLLLWGPKANRPLTKGKAAPIVKRTEGWKNSLQNRIEDMMELYEEKSGYWESVGGGEKPAAPDVDDRDTDLDDSEKAPESIPAPPVQHGAPLDGIFTKYRNEWAAKVIGTGSPGAKAILKTQGGRKVPVVLQQRLWSGQDNYTGGYVEIWSIPNSRQASGDGGDYNYDRSGVN